MAEETSRLLNGDIYYRGGYIPIEEYRNMIFARSLYSFDNEYADGNKLTLRNKNLVSDSVASILNVIPQYNRLQTQTNFLGNVLQPTPLTEIGTIMLGKQMLYNSAMNLSTKYLPSVDVSQALKGNLKGVFKLNESNTITVKNKDDKTFLDKVGSFASNFLGVDTYDVFGNANPFFKNPTNIDYIKNTGEAQLTRFYSAINLNIYKPVNYQSNSNYSKVFDDYSKKVGVNIDSTRISVLVSQPTFTFGNAKFHPYSGIKFDSVAIAEANNMMDLAYSGNTDSIQEYAPTNEYILNNFGTPKIPTPSPTPDEFVKPQSKFSVESSENYNSSLIWGRDGIGKSAKSEIKDLRGTDDNIDNDNPQEIFNENGESFKIREGLLEYTRNLLNGSSGQLVDITRKFFKKDDNVIGFQGSPLWRGNNSKYSTDSGNANKTGVRQHTALDPYDKFVKLIRFKGNVVYNGNDQSVINKTVFPRIHPTEKNGVIDNKKLMFSLENLAIGTIKREKYGVIDDEYGSPIPLSEVGPFAGRIMWFPPYNLEINEVAMAKYESTVMVGRNEPMYNYMNSERTAVLSFSLLIDHPEQLRNYISDSNDKNKDIADFFAFGGDEVPIPYDIEQMEKKIETLKEQIPEIEGPDEQAEPNVVKTEDVNIYFPNDEPKTGNVDTVINEMYNNPNHYEIINGFNSADDGNGFGLNNPLYFVENVSGDSKSTYGLSAGTVSNQYTATGVTSQFGTTSQLNKNLLDVYSDENNRKYYNITIEASASKLYLTENEKKYNEDLGDRRVAAAKKLILEKLKTMFGASFVKEFEDRKQIISVPSIGSVGSSDEGADPNKMHVENVKKERRATIKIARNNVPVEKKELKTTSKDKENIIKIQQEIQELEVKIASGKRNLKENVYKGRDKKITHGFETISSNEYSPAFHSQTPEEFHRRLTFLQQCTRQGAAKRYDIIDSNNELRARNSVFGRQPICILRVGDFFYTKVVIDTVTIDYTDTTWDMNPEGFGMQPMIANITLQMKLIGGQSLKGPIDALQNAVSFNYYANSSFRDTGMYAKPSGEAEKQATYIEGIVTQKQEKLLEAYKQTDAYKEENKKVTEGEE